jgi:DTW domain-containing protein YfiP
VPLDQWRQNRPRRRQNLLRSLRQYRIHRTGRPRLSEADNGKQVALSDDLCICRCAPPPRLVASQDFVMQKIDSDWHAGQSATTACIAEKLNADAPVAEESEGLPLLLLAFPR